MCYTFPCVLRGTSFPVQPVWCLVYSEGKSTASHQAPFRGETLQVSPVQLCLSKEGCLDWPFAHPLRSVCPLHGSSYPILYLYFYYIFIFLFFFLFLLVFYYLFSIVFIIFGKALCDLCQPLLPLQSALRGCDDLL